MIHCRRNHLISLLFMVSLLLSGCNGLGSPEKRSTESAQQTRAVNLATQMARSLSRTQAAAKIQATSTTQAMYASLNTARTWPIFLEDRFSSDWGGWITGLQESDLSTVDWQISNGKYLCQAEAKDSFIYWSVPDNSLTADFLLTLDVRQITAPEDADFGIIFRRWDDDNYYIFRVSEQGMYAVDQLAGGEWLTMVNWTDTAAIRPGQTNHLAVLGVGDTFSFFANDEYLGTTSDASYSEGSFGAVIGLYTAGDTGSWEFDNYLLRSPQLAPTLQP